MRLARIVFSLATLVGSFLLFLIQPMAAKALLPTFGGSPAVWTAAMLFFQVALLGGYAYAHGIGRPQYRQLALPIQIVLLATAIGLFLLSSSRPVQQIAGTFPPALQVFLMLLITVGPAYFMIASGSPTLQRWFAQTDDPAAKSPYFMYAISNIGSLAGLIAYPFWIEPRTTLSEQRAIFFCGLLLLLGLISLCTIWVRSNPVISIEAEVLTPTSWSSRRRWLILAAVPSSLLLGSTAYISSNVAPVPLIWIVPLGLYLVTFILAFSNQRFVTAKLIGRYVPLILIPLALTMCLETNEPLIPIASVHLMVFFLGAWMCHQLLSDEKPGPSRLTEFYLTMAAGGALGGLFNSLIAPTIFSIYAEYPIALVALCLLRPKFRNSELKPDLTKLVFGAIMIVVAAIVTKEMGLPPGPMRIGIGIGLPLILTFALADFIPVFALLLGATFFVVLRFDIASPGQVLTARRSFFGVHRVISGSGYRSLVHGTTTHGRQSLDPAKRRLALTYYYPTGPIGTLMSSPDFMSQVKSAGLVGLGVGSLATYGRPGQTFTYFEIDPEVLFLARDSGYFSFLKDSRATMRYVIGDARQTLSREPARSFDLLVLDAFSSDSIPTHLLTREAFLMYESKLRPGGLIALHISNRYLELAPVVTETAAQAGLITHEQLDGTLLDEERDGKTPSNWVLMMRAEGDKSTLNHANYWTLNEVTGSPRAWTDEFVNVLGAYRPEK